IVSKASDDLPDPLSPVITTSRSRGIVTSMFLRLCSRAPLITIELCIRGEIIACEPGCLDKPGRQVLPRLDGTCGYTARSEGNRLPSGSSCRFDLVGPSPRTGRSADVHLDCRGL